MNSRFKAFMTGDDSLKEEFNTENLVVAEALVKRDIQNLFNII